MNKIVRKTVWAGLVVMALTTTFLSCSDDWDDHYTSTAGLKYEGTLMGYLQSQADLSDFVEILKATGYDAELEASQVLTVMAPKNGSFDKAALLSQIANGERQTVIDEFVKNHVCRYNVSMGTEEQLVTMLNKKNLTVGTQAEATIEGANVPLMNVSCTNGVLHVLDSYIPYKYNIYEYLAKDYKDNYQKYIDSLEDADEFESFYGYLKELYIDSLDEARSVSRGVDENGNQVWVDSVLISNNKILSRMDAFLYREDSSYITILPSFEAYNKRYQGIKELFNFNISYNSDPAVRDSMSRYFSHYYAMSDLSYNMGPSQNHAYNDSLFSTVFRRYEWPYHVYYNPYSSEGIMANYDEYECSNGSVYRMNEYPFDVYSNIFRKLTLECEYRSYVYEDGDKAFTNTQTTTLQTVTNSADSISGSGYMHITPATSNRNTEFTYYLPNTLSGQYDIYVKFLPIQVYDTTRTRLPVQFRASLYERNAQTGAFPAETRPTYEFLNGDSKSKNFQTNPNSIDSLYVGTYRFNYCYHSTSPGVLFKLESYVLTSQASKFTKEMLIDKIILVPNREVHDENGHFVGSNAAPKRKR